MFARCRADHLFHRSAGAFSLVEQKKRTSTIRRRDGLRQHAAGEPLHIQIFDRDRPNRLMILRDSLWAKSARWFATCDVGPLKHITALRRLLSSCLVRRATLRWHRRRPASAFRKYRGFSNPFLHRKHRESWPGRRRCPLVPRRPAAVSLRAPTLKQANQRPACRLIVAVLIVPSTADAMDLDMARRPECEVCRIGQQFAAVAIGRKGDAVVTARGSKRGSRLSSLRASHGRRTPGRFYRAAATRPGSTRSSRAQVAVGPHRLQLVRLVVVVDRLAADFPGGDFLFESGVIKRGRVPQFHRPETLPCAPVGYNRYLKVRRATPASMRLTDNQ